MTKNKEQRLLTKDRIFWILFISLLVFVYFSGLNLPLLGPDEPRYAQIAREMFERGDWITPKLGGFDWFEKPALLYWLQIVAYKIFGVSEFAARFGSALFGLGTIFCLWIFGKFSATENTENTERLLEIQPKENFSENSVSSVAKIDFAKLLVMIAASSIGLIAFSHGASFDIILTFPLTASLVAFFIFDQSTKKSGFVFYFALFAFYFFIGVALLAKGLIGIVFPFAIVAFYYLLARRLPNKIFIVSLIWGTILSLLVAAIWYLPMYQANGWKFIDEFFIQHHFRRFTSDKYQHHQPFWFFFIVLPLLILPWLPFFLLSIWNLFKVQSSKFKVQSPTSEVRRRLFLLPNSLSPQLLFALAWLLVLLVFFTLSGSKLPGYILPALPAAIILTAEYVARFVQNSKRRKVIVQSIAFLTLIIAAFALYFVVPRYAAQDSDKYLIEAANAQGYANNKIGNLFTVSHNAEFYAPNRLLRDDDGKLKRFDDFKELVNSINQTPEQEILLLVSHENLQYLTSNGLVETKILADNGANAITAVKIKTQLTEMNSIDKVN